MPGSSHATAALVTRHADHAILRGITRTVLFDAIKAQRACCRGASFTVEEAYGAREAFITSASQIVLPVVRIDGRTIGNGKPGSGGDRPSARLTTVTPRPDKRSRPALNVGLASLRGRAF